MPSFDGSQIHVNRPLANLATAYENHELIGTRLMPETRVDKPSDSFFKRDKGNGFAFVEQPLVANLEVPHQIDQGVTLGTFTCRDYALQGKVSQRDQVAADAPLNLMQEAAIDVAAQLRLAQEIRIAAKLQATGSYASSNVSTLTGADRWDAAGGGDPLGIIDTMRSRIFPCSNTRLVAWMGLDVWNVLKRHPQIVSLVIGGATVGQPAVVSRQKLAEVIEVNEVLVGEAWKQTNNPAVPAVTARVWGKYFGIARVAASPTTRTLHFGTSFAFGPMNAATWFDEEPGLLGAWHVKISHSTDEMIVADDAGSLIVSPIS